MVEKASYEQEYYHSSLEDIEGSGLADTLGQTKLKSFRVCLTRLRGYKSLQSIASRAKSPRLFTFTPLHLPLYAQG